MKIRLARKEDMIFLFKLRNERSVRQSSFNVKSIPFETHRRWFNRILHDKNLVLLICEDRRIQNGQARFEIDPETNEASVHIALAKESRGKGMGVKMLKASCNYIFRRYPVRRIHAFIKPQNAASLKTFARADFECAGTPELKNHKCVEMILTHDPTR